ITKAQARFALSFGYEEALESQVSGKRLQIPVWMINDYSENVPVKVHCQITDLSGNVVWSRDFESVLPADSKKQVGVIEWTTPDNPGVYVLHGEAIGQGKNLQALSSTFIKVTPALFSRPLNVLLISQKKYALPIAELLRSTGVNVHVIDENSLDEFA